LRFLSLLFVSFFVLTSCNKDYSSIGLDALAKFVFVERTITTTGEIIEMDTTKFIRIRTIEHSISFDFDKDNRILQYTSKSKAQIDNNLLVWIASDHYFFPPDKWGLSVQMNLIYSNSSTCIDSNLMFGAEDSEGSVEFFDSRLGASFELPVDSIIVYTFINYKKVPLYGGDPLTPPDSALIKLTDVVKIHNWGYLDENQVIWKSLNKGE
jgi:hypothetical protein